MEYQKTVYIFGAGASIGSDFSPNMPGISNFISKGHSFSKIETYKNLFRYIDSEWNIKPKSAEDYKSYNNLNIEELYTHIDISINKFESNDYLLSELIKVKRELFLFMINTLNQAQDHGFCSIHKTFSNSIEKRDTIISFNWDTLLDTALLNSESGHFQFNQLKRIAHDFQRDTGGPLGPIPFDFDEGIYLKLHGSFNWLVCENNGCSQYGMVYINYYRKDDHFICGPSISILRCSRCNSHMKNVFVPPTINKTFKKHPSINNLWNFAYRELERATKIIVIGYSLPPTDFLSNWLLRSACDKGKINEVIIVDPQNDDLSSKYSNLLGINLKIINTSFKTFKDFVESL